MANEKRADYVAREAILNLLSNEELGRVSNAESANGLTEGTEYLDLDNLERGVQRATAATELRMSSVLPRHVIGDDTWSKILARLAT